MKAYNFLPNVNLSVHTDDKPSLNSQLFVQMTCRIDDEIPKSPFNMVSQVWDEITYPFLNFTAVATEVADG